MLIRLRTRYASVPIPKPDGPDATRLDATTVSKIKKAYGASADQTRPDPTQSDQPAKLDPNQPADPT